MPQTSDEHRARWPGGDEQACDYLREAGYSYDRNWCWHMPLGRTEPTDRELDAIDYMCLEWDWGGLVR